MYKFDQNLTMDVVATACEFLNQNFWLVATTLFVGYVLWKTFYGPWNLPPGPLGLPLVGALSEIKDPKNMQKDFMRLGQKYGDVFSMYLGQKLVIVLNSHDAIKEAFATRGSDFADRPKFGVGMKLIKFNDEIVNSGYTEKWKANKKFSVQALRASGFGSNEAEKKILYEVDELIKYLEGNEGLPVNMTIPIECVCGNVINSVVMGKRYTWDDRQLRRLIQGQKDMLDSFQSAFTFGFLGQYLPLWMLKWKYPEIVKKIVDLMKPSREYVKEQIDEHRATFDPNNMRDFMDRYLKERKDDPDFTESRFTDSMLSFMPDAIGTLSAVILWNIKYLAAYPEEQKKLQQEIDEICSSSRQPNRSDRTEMPHVEAFITEVFRIASVVPFSIQHKALQDTTFRGYNFPAANNVNIMANLYGAHNDPRIFPNPDEFKPSRHFNKAGEFVKTDAVIPFSMGRRMCMGEQLARVELFLIVANLVQRFDLRFADEKSRNNLTETDPENVVNLPAAFEIIVTSRA